MCGIAGFIGQKKLNKNNIDECLKKMNRRGPDSHGIYQTTDKYNNNVVLLHSRLKIIDTDDRANQPLEDDGGVLVYNGEIYNYKDLIDKYKVKWGSLKTTSDSEVLFKVIRENGIDKLSECEGMWAFAYYDKLECNLYFSRDRFGEKPLYVYKTDDGLYFGSEVKFIMELVGSCPKINFSQINRFFVNGYRSLNKKDETFFDGVTQVKNSTIKKVSPNLQQVDMHYWIPPKYKPNPDIDSYDKAVEVVKETLIKAIGKRLHADVPLAFALSGGVDSTSVVSIAKKVFNYDVHAFTVVNEDKRFDESVNVNCTVNELGIDCTEIFLSTDNFIPKLKTMILQHDSPINFVAYYSHWLLLEKVKEKGFKVLLSGTAADEVFAGYYEHHVNYLADMYHLDKDKFDKAVSGWKEKVLPIIRSEVWRNENLYVNMPLYREHLYPDSDEFRKYLKYDWAEKFEEVHVTDSFLRNRTYNEIFYETTPGIMKVDDLNAMYFSIENRSPFLDTELFELMYTIPVEYLMCDGFSKSLLRDAMEGIAPLSVMKDPEKKGFNAPIYDLLDIKDEKVRSYLLDDSIVFDYVKKEMIEEFLKKEHLTTVESKFLWSFVNIKIFLEEYYN